MIRQLKKSILYIAAFSVVAFYGAPYTQHLSIQTLDWIFDSAHVYKDPFLRNQNIEVAAPPANRSDFDMVAQQNRPKKQRFGPLESRKLFQIKERSYGTLWLVAKNSAAHQFDCSLESPTPKSVKLKVTAFEQGCEIRYNVGKPSNLKFPLNILVRNKTGIRLLSQNNMVVVPRAKTKTY